VRRRPDLLIRLIAALKLLKGGMLVALGVGALSMRHHHDGALNTWIHALAADPHGRYLTELLARVTSLDAHRLRQIGVGSLAYASVFLVEGVGLLLRKPWAEIMTVLVTTSFIPLEVYELVEHRSWAKVAVIVVNVLVVLYLLRRLRREGHWPFRRSLER
jgi:uncharacterized membrane protein (DUF2068 family)